MTSAGEENTTDQRFGSLAVSSSGINYTERLLALQADAMANQATAHLPALYQGIAYDFGFSKVGSEGRVGRVGLRTASQVAPTSNLLDTTAPRVTPSVVDEEAPIPPPTTAEPPTAAEPPTTAEPPDALNVPAMDPSEPMVDVSSPTTPTPPTVESIARWAQSFLPQTRHGFSAPPPPPPLASTPPP